MTRAERRRRAPDRTPPGQARVVGNAPPAPSGAPWELNAVRFLVLWAAVEPERGVYDDAYLDQVAERMAWARQAGLVVVLDLHQDVHGEGFGGDGAPRWTCDKAH